MKIIIVNRFFSDLAPTGQLAADLAFDLAAAGDEVHVVASRLGYEGEGRYAAEETVRGVRIHRVWTSGFGRDSLIGRALDYSSFYLSATLRMSRVIRRGDIVIALTDPPLLSVFAAFATRLRRARLINWVQDLFPEAAAALGFDSLSGPFGAPFRAARDRSLRTAVINVALGDRMAERLRAIGGGETRVRVVHNWADGNRIRPLEARSGGLRAEWGLEARFVVGYSGNMGRAHDIETLLAACVIAKADPGLAFVFIGGGKKRSLVQEAITKNGLKNVRLLPYVDISRLSESLGACDAHIVSLLPVAEGLIVPSKFYGIAAAGRPVLFIGDADGEIARVVHRFGCGACVLPGQVDRLLGMINEFRRNPGACRAMGLRARAAFESEWDKPIALARWRTLIAEVRNPGS